ncbi:MAG: tRNA lysidine(34) synthetase TilS [Methylotenera sp.]|nr:tRNA lysidine(34) synthetase TilS [Methylotenera sp.]
MVVSKKSLKKTAANQPVNNKKMREQSPLLATLQTYLSCHLKPNATLLLALSGGLDSCVLLHLLVGAKQTHNFNLRALHVHHGLSANADAWAAFCAEQCELLNVPLEIVHVNLNAHAKLGIEAAARKLRYEVLFSNVSADFVVTAHHQDDQAETLLLQLFRGAGVKGLASMAMVDAPRRLMRPLLDISRSTLQAYAVERGIAWCDDESNSNTDFERNFVRHEVLPVVQMHYPAIKSVLARTASHLAEANNLLDTLASLDAENLLKENSLCLQGLSALDEEALNNPWNKPRAKNVLRWWFAKNKLVMPNAEHLDEIITQLLNAKVDANLNISLQHLTLKRYQQKAYLIQAHEAHTFDLVWSGENFLALPNGGKLVFTQVKGAGLALKFGMEKLRITNRNGGERFKPNSLRPTRTLKHLLQEANIPPWQRDSLPLIYWHDTLAFVPNIGVAHELQAAENELGLVIDWQQL